MEPRKWQYGMCQKRMVVGAVFRIPNERFGKYLRLIDLDELAA